MSLADARIGEVSLLDLIKTHVNDNEDEVLDALMSIAKVAIEVAGEPTQYKVTFAEAEPMEYTPLLTSLQMERLKRIPGYISLTSKTELNGNVVGGTHSGYKMLGVIEWTGGGERLAIENMENGAVTWDYADTRKYILR